MKKEDRNHIARVYGTDVQGILRSFNKSRETEEKYLDYRQKFEASTSDQYEKPLELILELNNYCNMKCKMCYRNYYSFGEKHDISNELLDSILDEAKELKIPAIRIGAGAEGTLHHDINNVLRKISESSFLDFWMITNGSRLRDETFLNTIMEIPLTHLSISLDAATPETYSQIRGGDLDSIESGIMRLLELRKQKKFPLPILRVTFVEMPENRHEKDQFIDKWTNVADIVDIQVYIESDPTKTAANNKEKGSFNCVYPFKSITISFDGELKPCCKALYTTDKPIYLGKDYKSLMDYWNSDWFRSLCNDIAAKQYKGVCAKCVENHLF